MKNNIVFYISPETPHLTKILVCKLWAKMLSANQIAGFFKVYVYNISVKKVGDQVDFFECR